MPYSNIDKPASYFNTVLYTGTGATLSITGVGFQPDWVWTKGRSVAFSHYLFDSVRGVGKRIISNSTSNEDVSIFGVSSFNSDGFTLGTDTGANNSGSTFVSWNWLASNTTVSNTSGTISSTVSANTTSGFSIVSYTGTGSNATVGHGLGVAPSMLIVKSRNTTSTYWCVYQKSMWETSGTNYTLLIPDTGASSSRPTLFNSTQPTSSVFSIGTNGGVNGNTQTYIAYCFAEVKGYSKFGSYKGNGSTNGTFVYTGFKPAFVMAKASSVAGYSWAMSDNKRNPFNQANNTLYANVSDAEYTSLDQFDLLSNGFKLRSIYGNTTGDTYIYMAFAENPFVSSKGIPTTAR
jgi:hypothetical protein